MMEKSLSLLLFWLIIIIIIIMPNSLELVFAYFSRGTFLPTGLLQNDSFLLAGLFSQGHRLHAHTVRKAEKYKFYKCFKEVTYLH